MNQWKATLRRFTLSPSRGDALDALRIVVGAAMIAEALLLFPYISELYGQTGYLQSDLVEAISGPSIPGLLSGWGLVGANFLLALKCFYAFHLALAVGLLLGLQTQFVNIALWITQTLLINSGYFSSYGLDRYFQNLLFLMMFMPVASVISIDRWRSGKKPETTSAHTVCLRVIQIFVLMTYANAGFGKALGSDWWNGEAIWRVLNQPEFQRSDFLWLARHPDLAQLLSRGTIFLEGFYFAAVWLPKSERFGVWGSSACISPSPLK